jgi:hypothetical protein
MAPTQAAKTQSMKISGSIRNVSRRKPVSSRWMKATTCTPDSCAPRIKPGAAVVTQRKPGGAARQSRGRRTNGSCRTGVRLQHARGDEHGRVAGAGRPYSRGEAPLSQQGAPHGRRIDQRDPQIEERAVSGRGRPRRPGRKGGSRRQGCENRRDQGKDEASHHGADAAALARGPP